MSDPLRRALLLLSERLPLLERYAVQLRFGLLDGCRYSRHDVARIAQVTESQVLQAERSARRRLRREPRWWALRRVLDSIR